MSFREIDIKELSLNPFTKIGSEWMLITAGDEKGFNTMTASWGSLGVLWNKNAATCYIRPQRYTKQFVDSNEKLTLSFYPESLKDALTICGRKSGRDCDKAKEAGLTPCFLDGTTAFEEAELVFVCKKMFHSDMKPEQFLDPEADEKVYPNKDYHTIYICEVEKVYVKA